MRYFVLQVRTPWFWHAHSDMEHCVQLKGTHCCQPHACDGMQVCNVRDAQRRAGMAADPDSIGTVCVLNTFWHSTRLCSQQCINLQGSESIESWRTNLSFDPAAFEDPALGVHVHRGVYGAALAVYPRFAAMVAEHLATSPYARISFTGHSLGGSIATCVALMLIHRGVVRPSQLGPVYTFGAAACFCECGQAAAAAAADGSGSGVALEVRCYALSCGCCKALEHDVTAVAVLSSVLSCQQKKKAQALRCIAAITPGYATRSTHRAVVSSSPSHT